MAPSGEKKGDSLRADSGYGSFYLFKKWILRRDFRKKKYPKYFKIAVILNMNLCLILFVNSKDNNLEGV